MKDVKPHFYKKLYIGPSTVSGQGLFAGEDIYAGELVLSFGGVLALIDDRHSGKYLSSTFSGIAEKIMICENSDSEKDFSDYINHSCDPNVGMDDCITVKAIRDIKKGEEILCDYSFWEADCSWILKSECNCGSRKCRKIITGQDWKKVSSSNPRFHCYAPFLQRRIIRYEEES